MNLDVLFYYFPDKLFFYLPIKPLILSSPLILDIEGYFSEFRWEIYFYCSLPIYLRRGSENVKFRFYLNEDNSQLKIEAALMALPFKEVAAAFCFV